MCVGSTHLVASSLFLSNLDFLMDNRCCRRICHWKAKQRRFYGNQNAGTICFNLQRLLTLRLAQEICLTRLTRCYRLTLAKENFRREGYCYSSCIWVNCTGICPCLEPAHFLDEDQDLTSACFLILSYSSFVQIAKCGAQSISWVGGCSAAKQKLSNQTILPLDVILPQAAPALRGTRCRKELDTLRDEDLSYGKQAYKSFPFSST